MGKNCIGDDTETKECNTQACAVDGAFGKWSNFSECSRECGGGEMTRSRKCDSPKPQNGGKDCVGDTIETKVCNTQNCSSQCNWNHYPKTCVQGHNLKKYLGNTKSLTECKSLCMGRKDCLAVEYGVDYKGKGYPQPGDCLLQSSVDTENCDGGYWNLDLHVKPEKECAPKDNDAYAEKVCKGKCVHLKGNCGTMMGCGGQKFNVSKHCPVTCAITCPVISGATSCNADKGCKYYTGATMKHSQGETCSSWCSKHGMDCAGMYDDTGNTCNAKSSHTCGYTGDASDNDWICDCKAKVPEPESSTKYELLPAGLYECPAGAEKITTEDECGSAFKAIKAKYNLNNKRPLYAGDWNHVPAFCSVQRPGDDTPHFNRNTKPSNPKGYSLICKSQVPKDNDAYAEKVCKGKCVHLKGNCGTMMGCGGQKFDVSKHCPVTCAAGDGAFGKWSNFSECSKDCDGGEMTRSRKCDSPKPQNGGKNCVGDEIETKECNTQNCPGDGEFGKGSAFSKCSKECGGGQMTRSRSCDSPKPQYGGKDCVGDKIETKACNTQNCPTEPEEGKWILQKKDVCFAAKGNKPGFFDIQKVDGKLDGIKLVHKSGSVSCALFGDSNWGCNGNNIGVLVTGKQNKVIFPGSVASGKSWYTMAGHTSKSKSLVFKTASKTLSAVNGISMKVWYGEDLYNSTEIDNGGTSCADVYAMFKDITPAPPEEALFVR